MKRFISIFMTFVMAFSFSATAFAAEDTAATVAAAETAAVASADLPAGAEVLDVIEVEADENGMIAIPTPTKSTTLVDQSWNFTSWHQGSNRSYSYNTIGFKTYITDSNGNAVSDTISIKLYDTTTGLPKQTFTAYGNGVWYVNNNISIVANRQYYFYYSNLSSSTRTMSIHMVIYH